MTQLAVFVSRMGPEFERAVITRERGNPDFAFLWEPESRDGLHPLFTIHHNPTLPSRLCLPTLQPRLCNPDFAFLWEPESRDGLNPFFVIHPIVQQLLCSCDNPMCVQ